jgi:hypothetical protein
MKSVFKSHFFIFTRAFVETLVFWAVLALCADLYTEKIIRRKTGFYTSASYFDFYLIYPVLSLSLCLIFWSLNRIHWVFFFSAFALFTYFVIEDDLRFGRAVFPEIIFIVSIAGFHIYLLRRILIKKPPVEGG